MIGVSGAVFSRTRLIMVQTDGICYSAVNGYSQSFFSA